MLDPGHGGFDKGARNEFGIEKNYALDVARLLRPMLQKKGFKVILTRENDVFIPLHMRARIANATKDSIFVSIHFNGASNPEATGLEIFSLTPRGAPSTDDNALALHFVNMQAGSPVDAQSFALSSTVFHSMLGHLPEVDRGIKRARFAVLRHTKIPAILVEGGFLSETEQQQTRRRSRLAREIRRIPQPSASKATATSSRKSSAPCSSPNTGRRLPAKSPSSISPRPPAKLEETPPPIVPVTNPAPLLPPRRVHPRWFRWSILLPLPRLG